MAYEERIIDGVLHWRDGGETKWNAMSAQTLTLLYVAASAQLDALEDELEAAEQQAPFFPEIKWPFEYPAYPPQPMPTWPVMPPPGYDPYAPYGPTSDRIVVTCGDARGMEVQGSSLRAGDVIGYAQAKHGSLHQG
jgi:hypothetical protein